MVLGPWSDDVFRPLGYDIPLAVKRGYHVHYGMQGNATLSHPVRDADGGFSLAPMSKGIRLTTGVEFADRDAPPSPVQLARDEPLAHELFPLAERLDPEPWMGRRPCLPDMVPVIGEGEGHRGLWFAFGHAHHGFTLGPITGRLLAELMTGEEPFTERYYAASQFRARSVPTLQLDPSPFGDVYSMIAAVSGLTENRSMPSHFDRMFYAHSRQGEPLETWERLEWHLRRAGALARRFGRVFDAGLSAGASGLLHDVGKYSDAFQRRIAEDMGRVDHATGGAREAIKVYGKDIGHLLAYGIAGHHAGLPNGGSADEGALLSRVESKKIPTGHDRWKGRVTLPDPAAVVAELASFVHNNHSTFDGYGRAFLARMIFSCLVDADFLATEWFYDRGRSRIRRRPPDPAALAPVLRAYLDDLMARAAPTRINRQRAAILEACRASAQREPGVFSLDVPTGGGKTLSSLCFALEHAARYGLDRVIYAIPYTSIIEQTADVFRAALKGAGADIVVEHHSAADIPSRETGSEPIGAERLRLATENWDAPLVVTTTVQLFEIALR